MIMPIGVLWLKKLMFGPFDKHIIIKTLTVLLCYEFDKQILTKYRQSSTYVLF